MPQTWITAVYVPPAQAAQVDRLVQQFPNLTIVDTGAVVKQVVMVIDKVSLAVELLFGFTLAAGLVVLYAALLSSRDQRLREAALRRALGATRQQLQQGQLIEQVLIGLLAGSLAALLAQAIGWALAEFIFKFPWQFSPWVFLMGAGAGCACALLTGWLALRQVVQSSPLNLLREANE
jgi:putative ABC transport system permease protein